jgi:hypothetical protein
MPEIAKKQSPILRFALIFALVYLGSQAIFQYVLPER